MILFKKALAKELEESSVRWQLPLYLLRAIVAVESAGNIYATRYEHHYRWLYNVREDMPLVIRPDQEPGPPGFGGPGSVSKWTEYISQKTSWGPMQVMGAVAREYKFRGYLAGLCSPVAGVHYGCKHLYTLRSRWKTGDNEVALATSYNTGSPKSDDHPYWKKIKRAMERDHDFVSP